MESTEFIWTIASLLLTLFIFSYILGDNPLFRLASYIFIGVTAGLVTVVTIYQVIIPKLIIPMVYGSFNDQTLSIIPLILSLLLLGKLMPRLSRLGNLPMGVMVGVGAAVLVGGAVTGTIISQSQSVIDDFNTTLISAKNGLPNFSIVNAFILLIGTVSTLIYFHFSAKPSQDGKPERSKTIELISKLGGFFIAITFGALFAGVYSAALSALIERLDFIIKTFGYLISNMIF